MKSEAQIMTDQTKNAEIRVENAHEYGFFAEILKQARKSGVRLVFLPPLVDRVSEPDTWEAYIRARAEEWLSRSTETPFDARSNVSRAELMDTITKTLAPWPAAFIHAGVEPPTAQILAQCSLKVREIEDVVCSSSPAQAAHLEGRIRTLRIEVNCLCEMANSLLGSVRQPLGCIEDLEQRIAALEAQVQNFQMIPRRTANSIMKKYLNVLLCFLVCLVVAIGLPLLEKRLPPDHDKAFSGVTSGATFFMEIVSLPVVAIGLGAYVWKYIEGRRRREAESRQ